MDRRSEDGNYIRESFLVPVHDRRDGPPDLVKCVCFERTDGVLQAGYMLTRRLPVLDESEDEAQAIGLLWLS